MKRTYQTMLDEFEVLCLRRSQLNAEIDILKEHIAKHPETSRRARALEVQALREQLPKFLHKELLDGTEGPQVSSVSWLQHWEDVGDGTGKTRPYWKVSVTTADRKRASASGFVKELDDDDFMGLQTPKPSDTFRRTWQRCKECHDGELAKALAAFVLLAARWNHRRQFDLCDPRLLVRYVEDAF